MYKEGIAFHLTKKKAVLLPYKELGNTRKKFEITDGFQVYSYHRRNGNRENVGGRFLPRLSNRWRARCSRSLRKNIVAEKRRDADARKILESIRDMTAILIYQALEGVDENFIGEGN
ncbi:MAG: hypothetical protein ACLRTQ_10580 [Candidatus Borkfalkia sp.]